MAVSEYGTGSGRSRSLVDFRGIRLPEVSDHWSRRYVAALVILPAVTFGFVFMWGGSIALAFGFYEAPPPTPKEKPATVAELQQKIWPITPEMMEADQPELYPLDRAAPRRASGTRSSRGSCTNSARVDCLADSEAIRERGGRIGPLELDEGESGAVR
jgi:hypothetical protein